MFWARKRNLILIVVGILGFSLGFGFYAFHKKPAPIRIAVNEWPGFAPAVYAEILGLYQKNKIPIKMIYSPSPAQSYEWFVNDQVEGVGSTLADLISLRAAGAPVQAILFTDYSLESDSLISRSEIKKVSDLKGKTIGIDSLNSFSHVFVLKTIERFGLTERDVYFKVVPFDRVFEALQKNEVQAAHTWGETLSHSLRKGFRRLAHAGEIPNVILDCLGVRQDLLRAHPDLFRKFVQVFYEAQNLMLKDPIRASQQMKDFYKNNPTIFSEAFSEMHFIDAEENKRRWGPTAADSFLREALVLNEFFLRRGQTNESGLHENTFFEGLYQ